VDESNIFSTRPPSPAAEVAIVLQKKKNSRTVPFVNSRSKRTPHQLARIHTWDGMRQYHKGPVNRVMITGRMQNLDYR
jgi:hypothetical protein